MNNNLIDNETNNDINSHWYIWLINKDIQYHKSINGEMTNFRRHITYANNKYEIELLPKYTHHNYMVNTDITFCDIKFLSKNGVQFDNKYDSFTQQSKSLSTCIKECNKLPGSMSFAFTFRLYNVINAVNVLLAFPDVVEDIYFEDNVYIIRISHENPIITAYYYCFMRFHLENMDTLQKYRIIRTELSEKVKYYLGENNSWYSKIIKGVFNFVNKDNSYKNSLELEITLPLLENGNLDDNYNRLKDIYKEFYPLVNYTLFDYIFNKYHINQLDINIFDNCKYIDNRANIYCNPFNLLYYHFSIINIYITDYKRDLIALKYNSLYNDIKSLISNNPNIIIDNLNTDVNTSANNISNNQDLLSNIALIKYFMKYFDFDDFVDEYSNEMNECSNEIIAYNNVLILFNEMKLVLDDINSNFEDKIGELVELINNSDIYKSELYKKTEIALLYDIIIIRLSTYPTSNNLIKFLKKIYKNYNLYYSDELNNIVYICLKEAESIINDIEDVFIPPKNIYDLIKEICDLYDFINMNNINVDNINDNINANEELYMELEHLYSTLLSRLSDFKIDDTYKQMVLEYELLEATEYNDNDINNTNNDINDIKENRATINKNDNTTSTWETIKYYFT
jgi:hypothetical protein